MIKKIFRISIFMFFYGNAQAFSGCLDLFDHPFEMAAPTSTALVDQPQKLLEKYLSLVDRVLQRVVSPPIRFFWRNGRSLRFGEVRIEKITLQNVADELAAEGGQLLFSSDYNTWFQRIHDVSGFFIDSWGRPYIVLANSANAESLARFFNLFNSWRLARNHLLEQENVTSQMAAILAWYRSHFPPITYADSVLAQATSLETTLAGQEFAEIRGRYENGTITDNDLSRFLQKALSPYMQALSDTFFFMNELKVENQNDPEVVTLGSELMNYSRLLMKNAMQILVVSRESVLSRLEGQDSSEQYDQILSHDLYSYLIWNHLNRFAEDNGLADWILNLATEEMKHTAVRYPLPRRLTDR